MLGCPSIGHAPARGILDIYLRREAFTRCVVSISCAQAFVVANLAALVAGCICLGRSPGWRRGYVEEAVRQAATL